MQDTQSLGVISLTGDEFCVGGGDEGCVAGVPQRAPGGEVSQARGSVLHRLRALDPCLKEALDLQAECTVMLVLQLRTYIALRLNTAESFFGWSS